MLAIEKYKETGKGISFNDLIQSGLVLHKRQAQDTLFVCGNHKLQQNYLFRTKSEIFEPVSNIRI
jgi:hypothetical protein